MQLQDCDSTARQITDFSHRLILKKVIFFILLSLETNTQKIFFHFLQTKSSSFL